MAFNLNPGDRIRRRDLHEQWGGRRQGGISPSRVTPSVFLFTDRVKGRLHGYLYDGWRRDGYFHYTGEGQFGDQRMVQGNRATRDHVEDGRTLHLLEVSEGNATYVGEFRYVDHYQADAPETGNGPIRSVLVFRLEPITAEPGPVQSKADLLGEEPMKEVPVEQHLTESMLIDPSREPYEAERREQKLVRSFMAHLAGLGHDVCRLQLRPRGEPAPMFCDLYDKTTNTIVEAKGTVARPAFRMAIGQLADYGRQLDTEPSKAILVPQQPRADLISLAESQGVTVVWPNGSGFDASAL